MTRISAIPLAIAFAVAFAARPAAAAPPVRKSGTVKVTVGGSRTASGTFPAVCGPYLMMDVRGVGKAGDGLVFETDVTGVGHLQVNSQKRVAGRSSSAGLVLNPSDGAGSYVGDAAAPNKVVFGPKLDTASVRATMRNLRRAPRGAPDDVITLQAEFDCSR